MDEETDPSTAGKQAVLTCPQCGAPLPLPEGGRFVTCAYCGVRTEVSKLIPSHPEPLPPEGNAGAPPPPFESTEDDDGWDDGIKLARVVVALVMIAVIVGVLAYAASPHQSNPTSSSTAHCSVAIDASATSGSAPFTATFTAQVTAPPGVSTGGPQWQFGPFGPGFDLNFTYGSTVSHTWNSTGTFGVHVTVPDSTGQGCWTTMSVEVT